MIYQHLLNSDFVVTQLLKDQNFAKEKVEGWVKAKLNIYSINELANENHTFNVQSHYVLTPRVQFTKLELDGQYYINPGTLAFWTGHTAGNVTTKLNYNKSLYGRLGVIQLDDGETPRTTFAKDRYMFAYERLSSKLTLIPPSAAAAFILTSSNERCDSFRHYIQDQVPELPYRTKRLTKTINAIESNV
jgi:hypothetical protein